MILEANIYATPNNRDLSPTFLEFIANFFFISQAKYLNLTKIHFANVFENYSFFLLKFMNILLRNISGSKAYGDVITNRYFVSISPLP
jgi:hypothetical protein